MKNQNSNHGFSAQDWNSAKAAAREIMISRAKANRTISYTDLVAQILPIKLTARDPRLFDMLGEISCEEDEKGRGMLTVLVVHKTGDMKPGPGFFDLAEDLGKDTSDLLACWIEELKYVHQFWAK